MGRIVSSNSCLNRCTFLFGSLAIYGLVLTYTSTFWINDCRLWCMQTKTLWNTFLFIYLLLLLTFFVKCFSLPLMGEIPSSAADTHHIHIPQFTFTFHISPFTSTFCIQPFTFTFHILSYIWHFIFCFYISHHFQSQYCTKIDRISIQTITINCENFQGWQKLHLKYNYQYDQSV